METEKESKIAFLDTSVSREPDGRLTTSVYRKPTHTDQYLAYDSHHPQSVKCGIVKCLYHRGKRLVTKPSVISEEKKHLSSVLVSNGYPSSFGRSSPGKEKQPPGWSLGQISSPPRFCRILKEYQNLFAAAYNNKVLAPSLSLTRHLGHI